MIDFQNVLDDIHANLKYEVNIGWEASNIAELSNIDAHTVWHLQLFVALLTYTQINLPIQYCLVVGMKNETHLWECRLWNNSQQNPNFQFSKIIPTLIPIC